MNVLVFDIETVPDVATGRRLYDLDGLSDADVANVMYHRRRQETGESEFLKPHLHRIVAISAVLRSRDAFKVWSLGEPESDERELIQRFFDGIDRFLPTLVSWNGASFDLPVMHYRALLHGVAGRRYWDTGDDDKDFRWNNYLNRYHARHTDLMDVLAGYQGRASAPLNEIAILLGFPGKIGIGGAHVWDSYQQGKINDIRSYCEVDVLNTYLIYLRYQLIRDQLTADQYQKECGVVREELEKLAQPHFTEFLRAWDHGRLG
ncbi:MAG: hypothetical protein FD165_688 [Gammaproteobacteria bacterium]|nr:MAG: hypothetical protein FD165_688 [Gammaproteobacteria bacterium]TND07015.1 MAG: hypothetical protein FD120_183 [Gammaproteobacteria bacterium]